MKRAILAFVLGLSLATGVGFAAAPAPPRMLAIRTVDGIGLNLERGARKAAAALASRTITDRATLATWRSSATAAQQIALVLDLALAPYTFAAGDSDP